MKQFSTSSITIVTTRYHCSIRIIENTDILEYPYPELKVPCLLLSLMLIPFLISLSLNTKGHVGSERTYSNFSQNFYFPNAPIWTKVLCNDCTTCQLIKPFPHETQATGKQDFKGQILCFNYKFSFGTKSPYIPLLIGKFVYTGNRGCL